MGKFNKSGARARVGVTPIQAASSAITVANHLGGASYIRDAKSELFMLGISNLVGEKTFHEKGMVRDERFANLIHEVARQDSEWLAKFLPWLRKEANLRSAPLVGALEAAKAMIDAKIPGSRKIIASVGDRPDEPGEMLAYWHAHYGRNLPMPVKRGIADLAVRLYDERGLLKYDTAIRPYRFADVIELCHPKVGLGRKSDLMRHALDRRHRHGDVVPESLTIIRARKAVKGVAIELMDEESIKDASLSWENTISAAADKTAVWEKQIPSMGYMALLRNLRNIGQAGLDGATMDKVATRIADPDQVRRSRQFPFRFLSAYKANEMNLRWAWALEQALNSSMANVPELKGNTLIMVDCSGSMGGPVSDYSDMSTREIAALFGSALHIRNKGNSKLVAYGTSSYLVGIPSGASILTGIKQFKDMGWTNTAGTLTQHLEKKHDRVIIITDEQHTGVNPSDVLPENIPLYIFSLVGYRYGTAPNRPNRVTIGGGLSDASFKIISLLESGRNGSWPWDEAK